MATAGRVPQRGGRRERAERLAEQLCASRRGWLLAIARRNSACAEEAEEALQDALILFIDRFDPAGDAPPLAWLTIYADLCVMPTWDPEAAPQAEIIRMRSA